MTADILASIAAYKREEVATLKAAPRDLEADMAQAGPPRGFARALRAAQTPGRLALVAEIKKASPSRGLIRADYDPPALARAYARGGATCLSVLTDGPSFQGLEADLVAARGAVDLPCLRKDFLVDPWQVAQSRAMGADAILVILAMVDDSLAAELIAEAARLGMDALVETHDAEEFARARGLGARLIGINNRDLRTFHTDIAVTERLIGESAGDALIVTESGIATSEDVGRLAEAGANAMLVGESLMRNRDVEAATRALVGA
jgi:indole-3-glycerol phosphate synthase